MIEDILEKIRLVLYKSPEPRYKTLTLQGWNGYAPIPAGAILVKREGSYVFENNEVPFKFSAHTVKTDTTHFKKI